MKILVFRGGGIGDMVLTIPALRAIRKIDSGTNVTLLSDWEADSISSPIPLLFRLKLIDHYFQIRKTSFWDFNKLFQMSRVLFFLRKNKFDFSICLRHSLRSGAEKFIDHLVFYRLIGAKIGIGFHTGTNLINFYTGNGNRLAMRQESERLVGILSSEGIDFDWTSLFGEIRPANDVEINKINETMSPIRASSCFGLCPFAKLGEKEWPTIKYAQACKILWKRYKSFCLIVGGGEDYQPADKFIKENHLRAINTCGKLSVIEVCELLSRCVFYLGNDTGPMHLAASAGIPCVSLFSNHNNPGKFYPKGNRHVVLRGKRAIENISVAEVADACQAYFS